MAKPLRKLLTVVFAIVTITVVDAIFVYRDIPTHNTNLAHFDTIIVLGTPANPNGTPSPEQRERTLESVHEYKASVAPELIFTGAAAHNQFVEAHVMATLAIAQGVPPSAVIEEDQAQNTVQNIFYSEHIMAQHGWTSAEVVSSPSHLPRTALILEALSDPVAHPFGILALGLLVLATRRPLRGRSRVLSQAANLRIS